MVTRRLYYDDAYCTTFSAKVTGTIDGTKGTQGILLDQTCFYPESGGQPSDHGLLGGQSVIRVEERGDDIVHWIKGRLESVAVEGTIDWQRRFDHMQQHTGQHILSQAFLQALDAQTVSFHLGVESATIDLDATELDGARIDAVEDLANRVVFSDRPISTRFITAEELTRLVLRKTPAVDKEIRIVTVEGIDATPCGGTHCSRTGEVGCIAMRKWERRGQESRVEFLCGWRALLDYRWKTRTCNEMALSFSVKDRELPDAVMRLTQEAGHDRRELQRLQEDLLSVEATRLIASARVSGHFRIVVQAFDDRDAQHIRRLASQLAGEPRTVALLGVSAPKTQLVFARSGDIGEDMGTLLRATCGQFGGAGGGQPGLAQGGSFPGTQVPAALDWAYERLTKVEGSSDA